MGYAISKKYTLESVYRVSLKIGEDVWHMLWYTPLLHPWWHYNKIIICCFFKLFWSYRSDVSYIHLYRFILYLSIKFENCFVFILKELVSLKSLTVKKRKKKSSLFVKQICDLYTHKIYTFLNFYVVSKLLQHIFYF